MMATVATSNNFEDSSTVTAQQPDNAGELQQDGAATPPQVNGEGKSELNKQQEALGDDLLQPNSADVSVNGGSDNEAARSENSKSDAEGKSHNRTTSTIKKPISFKAVSVNKTFLAAKVATGAITPKSDGKASPSPSASATPSLSSSTPKPRLVAKTGSSLRDSSQRNATVGTGGTTGGAASAVWNKNQPVAPQEPKRLTDEELKQRYGIHLATRLQTDDQGNKQATWADIDEDEDDWAPDSIVWGDGTKASLAPVDEPAPTPPPQVQPVPVEEVKAPEPKPRSPAPLSTATSSPSLKLGGISSTSGKGLVLKGAAEKPTLVAKPPGPPTPVKSPWAPLPPVDKSSPVVIDPPQAQQQYQPRFTNRNPHGFEGMPPHPAKEIAADDFSRSAWREGNANQNRELYNSHSGRYEPVNDNRRGSRTENSRLPAVLQRPSHSDHSGPAEPSAAFQTHRSSADGSHGRRRTSSNVSGGSGHFARRMSSGRHDMVNPHEMHSARRGSIVAVSDAPTSPRPISATANYLGPRSNSNMSHPSPASVHAQPVAQQPQVPYVDEVEIQKKIMRESRETARKRRLEEEAREEVERKERIRLKLEAMGPAPEKKPKKEAVTEDKQIPTQIQARKASISATSPVTLASEVANISPDEAPVTRGLPPAASQDSTATSSAPLSHDSNRASNGGDRPSTAQNKSSYQSHENKSPTRPWQSGASDSFPSWNQVNPPPTSSRSVWGPPSNNKALGNGTFDPELGGLPDIHSSQQPIGSAPGPIGPPYRNSQQYDRSSQYNSRPAPIGPPQGASRSDQQRRPMSGWNNPQEEQSFREQQENLSFSQQGGVSSEAPPVYKDTWRKSDSKDISSRSSVGPISKPSTAASGWNSFASQIAKDDAAKREEIERQDVIRRQQRATGQLPDPVYRDTWKEVALDQSGARTAIRNTTTTINGVPATQSSNISPNPRGSRFFPVRDVRLEEQNSPYDRPGSPSPPPPTTFGHPAYDGNVEHPTVCIPPPAPRVKLPPPAALQPIGPPKPPSFAAAAATPVVPALPMNYAARVRDSRPAAEVANPENWQKRISNLLGRGGQQTEPRALAVDSASKHALELPDAQTSATVTLPGVKDDGLLDPSTSLISKPMAEECFEEQEMGSLPIVKVPRGPTVPWMAIEAPKTNLRKSAPPHTTSIDTHSLSFPYRTSNTIQIKFSFMEEPKLISMSPREPRQKSTRGRGRGQPRHASTTYPRGGRAREASGGFSSPPAGDQAASTSSSSPRPNTRGRGGLNSSSHWNNRNISTPVS